MNGGCINIGWAVREEIFKNILQATKRILLLHQISADIKILGSIKFGFLE